MRVRTCQCEHSLFIHVWTFGAGPQCGSARPHVPVWMHLKTELSPLVTNWRYCSLSHQYIIPRPQCYIMHHSPSRLWWKSSWRISITSLTPARCPTYLSLMSTSVCSTVVVQLPRRQEYLRETVTSSMNSPSTESGSQKTCFMLCMCSTGTYVLCGLCL